MLENYAADIINELKDLDHFVLAIDGNAGSGKTTLSKLLAETLNATLVHMDDFYMPIKEREKDWFETPGGNINFKRIEEEIIIPYINKSDLKHKEFKPCEQELIEFNDYKYNPKLIIEGSYSMHPKMKEFISHKLFLECNSEIQEKRLIIREADNYQNFKNIWIVKELNYHQAFKIKENADYIIDTSKLF